MNQDFFLIYVNTKKLLVQKPLKDLRIKISTYLWNGN